MPNRNFIFLDKDVLDKPIYRIFPIARFLQILSVKKLTLVKPHKWDDPFENALLKSQFRIGSESAEFEAKNSVYGQCWTQHRETDAMWRIYSHDKDGVRLRTTPKMLLSAMRNACPDAADVRCFIGKVQYKSKNDIIKAFGKIDLLDTNGSGVAESLLYKRKEFQHEKEVRLIYSGEDGKCASDIFQFEIDPNALFDRVLFDPRMDDGVRKSYTAAVQGLGCTVEVKRSTLYDAPDNLSFKLS